MNHGTVAIAVVQHQVMIIQAVRSHDRHDRWLDVYTYAPFGNHMFLESSVPRARIASSDVLIVFPFRTATADMIELPTEAYQKFMQLKAKYQKQQDNLWRGWQAKLR
ncbi:hypothetical protein K503DRAFT_740322 [Rhizopogon vinicolor AM-OR11-026]|uniref:Uncharacterized protein n=1 Tax=Rhizopogon vinicolor AM-OR11-026 TaxID=1314800 RepID=A0A1B7N2A8_9AGAM|nr:hypothetical protein K503DRAFT_740322 [Rhizopogon vinicolor AM-OR11-026]